MIAHSSDDGATFELVSSGLAGQPQLRRLAGTSATDVWLVGDDGAGGPVVLHSSDRGQSWQSRPAAGLADVEAVWAIDAARVLLATGDGRILRSDDGGGTWGTVFQGSGTRLFSLWGSVAGVVYAVGGQTDDLDAGAGAPALGALTQGPACDGGADGDPSDSDEHGVVLRSDDGGVTWAAVGVRTPGHLLSVWGRPDGSTVIAAGVYTSIAVTSDAGAHWLARAQVVDAPQFDFTDVWVGPGDGALFMASPGGLIRDVAFACNGSVQLAYESVPPSEDGSPAVAAVWGPSSGDVWAVGPGGAIRHRP
jgi:photosystem II stability/assembly factor-like uncharacterized protein